MERTEQVEDLLRRGQFVLVEGDGAGVKPQRAITALADQVDGRPAPPRPADKRYDGPRANPYDGHVVGAISEE